ncbi:hypothetical protein BaRGS_00010479 [Batillaria attramentaria]|uniref:Uncharacterized protein n=1 Tax=Batillaria attramentaria TaxID=370345 RepID=A0ABD0LGY2_9CAEN
MGVTGGATCAQLAPSVCMRHVRPTKLIKPRQAAGLKPADREDPETDDVVVVASLLFEFTVRGVFTRNTIVGIIVKHYNPADEPNRGTNKSVGTVGRDSGAAPPDSLSAKLQTRRILIRFQSTRIPKDGEAKDKTRGVGLFEALTELACFSQYGDSGRDKKTRQKRRALFEDLTELTELVGLFQALTEVVEELVFPMVTVKFY